MNNPYVILKVRQDANKREIMLGQMQAMKEKRFKLQEIHAATRQLLDPAKRLAADFMFPAKIKARRIQKICTKTPLELIELITIDEDAFDSLK